MTNPVRTPVSDRQSAGDAGAVATSAALGPWPQMMENPIRDYEWGSTIALARLQGRPSSGRPEAELWMGAHPSGPSRLVPPGVTDPGQGRSLDDLVTRRPLDLLGGEVFDRFGPRLPFLLKILAISRPLSVQVHPTGDRARTAFEGEAGSEGTHCYVDPFPKPELLYALEPIDAMCGFRPAADALRLLDLIGGERTATVAEPLRGRGDEGDRIEAAFKKLVTWPVEDRAALVVEIREATRELLAEAGPSARAGASPPRTAGPSPGPAVSPPSTRPTLSSRRRSCSTSSSCNPERRCSCPPAHRTPTCTGSASRSWATPTTCCERA